MPLLFAIKESQGFSCLRYVLIQIWSFCAGRKTSCGGIFAYVCTEQLSFVDYLNPFVQDSSLCVDTQKAIY